MGNPMDSIKKTLSLALDAQEDMDRQQEQLNELVAENPEAATDYKVRQWQALIDTIRAEAQENQRLCEEAISRGLIREI